MNQGKCSLANNKKKIIIRIILLLVILFIPIPSIHGTYKDGGTKVYKMPEWKCPLTFGTI